MSRDYFKQGDWLAYCDRCKFERFASELVKEWTGFMVCQTGFMVCQTCFEPRHPQELRRQPAEKESVPWSRSTHSGAEVSPSWSFTIPDIPT